MAFNVKNEATHARVRELADKTGVSMAQAIDDAVSEKLERIGRVGLADRLMEIGREAAKHMPPEWRGRDSNDIINELLYDEHGMPK